MGNCLPAGVEGAARHGHRLRFLTPASPGVRDAAAAAAGAWFEYHYTEGAGFAGLVRRDLGAAGPPPIATGDDDVDGPGDAVPYDVRLGGDTARVYLSPDGWRPPRVRVPAGCDADRWLPRVVPREWLRTLAAAARVDSDACVLCQASPAVCRMPNCGHRALCPPCLLHLGRPRCPVCRDDVRGDHPWPVTYATLPRWLDLDFAEGLLEPLGRAWTDPLASPDDDGEREADRRPAPRDRVELEDAVHRAVDLLLEETDRVHGGAGRLRSGAYAEAERAVLDAALRMAATASSSSPSARSGDAPASPDHKRPRRPARSETDAVRALWAAEGGAAVQRLAREVWARLPPDRDAARHSPGDRPAATVVTWADLARYAFTRAADSVVAAAADAGLPFGDRERRSRWRRARLAELVRRCIVFERAVLGEDPGGLDEGGLQRLTDRLAGVARVWLEAGCDDAAVAARGGSAPQVDWLRAYVLAEVRGDEVPDGGVPLHEIVEAALAWLACRTADPPRGIGHRQDLHGLSLPDQLAQAVRVVVRLYHQGER